MASETGSALRIGDLAKQAGVTLRTLRYYESLQLIRPAPRQPGGFRFYDASVLPRLERIRQLKELLGFSLDEVRRTLEFEDAVAELRTRYLQTEDARERAQIVREAVAQTQRQIELVTRKRDLLAGMLQEQAERLARLRGLLEEAEE